MKAKRTKSAMGKKLADKIKSTSRSPVKSRESARIFAPTGSTLLNLACANDKDGGFQIGKIVTLPGGSSSGKTLLVITSLAICNTIPFFDDYDFYYDDAEHALEFDVGKYWGPTLEARMKAPAYDKEGEPLFSITIQDLQNNIISIAKKGKPFIYILDSFDSLSTSQELQKAFVAALGKAKSEEEIKDLKGSYKTEKAKIAGEILRMIKHELKKTGSILIMVQQIRQKIGVSFGRQTTTSGGEAPYFYSTHQIWLTRIATHKKSGLKIGQRVKAEVGKNKVTGKERVVEFDVYDNYGVDDTCSCLEFLKAENVLENATDPKGKTKPSTYVFEFGGHTPLEGTLGREGTLVRAIEEAREQGAIEALRDRVKEAWDAREASLVLNRRGRFE